MSESPKGIAGCRSFSEDSSEDLVKVVMGGVIYILAICLCWFFWRPSRTTMLAFGALGLFLYAVGHAGVAFRQLRRQLDRIESKLDSVSQSR